MESITPYQICALNIVLFTVKPPVNTDYSDVAIISGLVTKTTPHGVMIANSFDGDAPMRTQEYAKRMMRDVMRVGSTFADSLRYAPSVPVSRHLQDGSLVQLVEASRQHVGFVIGGDHQQITIANYHPGKRIPWLFKNSSSVALVNVNKCAELVDYWTFREYAHL